MDQFSGTGALFAFSCSQFDCRLLLKLPEAEARATTELTWGLQDPTKASAPFMRVFRSWRTHPLTRADAAIPLSTLVDSPNVSARSGLPEDGITQCVG